jgi:predicted nuclease of restriction endonuclease-like RecB superfamily
MLTGKQVRVRVAKNKLLPMYLDPTERHWQRTAEQLLAIYRGSVGRTRGEIEEELANFGGDGPQNLVLQGLAKLLEDRCEFEVAADHPPEEIRDAVFKAAAVQRSASKPGDPFDRAAVMESVGKELGLTPEQLHVGLFADLKDEQKVLAFEDITPERLVDRYNVALAQALLLRSTGMEVRVTGETPARYRQLFRSLKFHRLIGSIQSTDGKGYLIKIDGPLSLFSSTQKYGMQLANFLPSLLHAKHFDLTAKVRWGATKAEKTFALSSAEGLKSHRADFGVHTPRELELFEENFRANVPKWVISSDPAPMPLESITWVPDFAITHTPTGKVIYLEVIGFWRKVDVEATYKRLKRTLPGQFILIVSEAYRADESSEFATGDGVYRFKRTPVAGDVATIAEKLVRG